MDQGDMGYQPQHNYEYYDAVNKWLTLQDLEWEHPEMIDRLTAAGTFPLPGDPILTEAVGLYGEVLAMAEPDETQTPRELVQSVVQNRTGWLDEASARLAAKYRKQAGLE